MVHVVNSSHYGYGYLENNLQLAKKVSELEQQLGIAIQEIQQLKEISHRKDVKIVELEGLVNDLQTYREKHDAIKNIILDARPIKSTYASVIHQTTSIQALTESHCETSRNSPLRLPSTSHIESLEDDQAEDEIDQQPSSPQSDGSNSTRTANESHDDQEEVTEVDDANDSSYEKMNSSSMTPKVLHPIIEDNEEEEDDEDKSAHDRTNHSSLPSPSPTQTISPIEDSLMPADVTSVPPINQPERTIHTPSIWNCLDPIESPTESQTKQQHQPEQNPTLSPTRSVESSISGGLRISQNINSSSPIQPITRKLGPNLNDDIFHSTPVQGIANKGFSCLLNRKSISDPKLSSINQENLDSQATNNRTEETNVGMKKQPTKRGRPAAPTKAKRPVRRAVKFTDEEDQAIKKESIQPSAPSHEVVQEAPPSPKRYNLRKRVKT